MSQEPSDPAGDDPKTSDLSKPQADAKSKSEPVFEPVDENSPAESKKIDESTLTSMAAFGGLVVLVITIAASSGNSQAPKYLAIFVAFIVVIVFFPLMIMRLIGKRFGVDLALGDIFVHGLAVGIGNGVLFAFVRGQVPELFLVPIGILMASIVFSNLTDHNTGYKIGIIKATGIQLIYSCFLALLFFLMPHIEQYLR